MDEKEYSLLWVLENCPQSMKGCHLKIVLINQDLAVSVAIAHSFTRYYLSLLLMPYFSKCKSNLGKLFKRGSKFGQDLSYYARTLETIGDFF